MGGHGGSFAQKYWDLISFPNFSVNVQTSIAKLYYNKKLEKYNMALELEDYIKEDENWTSQAGIYQLGVVKRQLQEQLNSIIEKIINDEPV